MWVYFNYAQPKAVVDRTIQTLTSLAKSVTIIIFHKLLHKYTSFDHSVMLVQTSHESDWKHLEHTAAWYSQYSVILK